MSDRPNIIYIVSQDLGRMLGCCGRGFKSPNLDRFASQGALFNKTFCTTTACSPSRGCAWTGQYAHNNGLMGLVNRGWSLPVERRTIVDLMNDAGYHTALVGLDHVRAFREDHRFVEYRDADPRTAIAADNAIEFLRSRVGNDQPFYSNMGTIEVLGSQLGTWHANRQRTKSEPLEAIGEDIPDDVDGRSFWPLLTDGDYMPAEMIFAERNYHGGSDNTYPDGTKMSFDPMRSVRTEKYHLIQTFGEGRRSNWTPETVPEVLDKFEMYPSQVFPGCPNPREEVELFDLEKDPYDWHNMANDPAYAEVRDELMQVLATWRKETKDPLLEGPIPDEMNPWPEAPTH